MFIQEQATKITLLLLYDLIRKKLSFKMNTKNCCLICNATDIPLQPIKGYPGSQTISFTNQLQVVLLLRKVLRLRRDFVGSVLRTSGENPDSWDLKLCQLCHRVFEEASFVASRLTKLNQEFEELSETLRSKIAHSWTSDNLVGNVDSYRGTPSSVLKRGHGGKQGRGVGRPSRKRKAIEEDGNERASLPFKIRRQVAVSKGMLSSSNNVVNDKGFRTYKQMHIKIEIDHNERIVEEDNFDDHLVGSNAKLLRKVSDPLQSDDGGEVFHDDDGEGSNISVSGDDDYVPLPDVDVGSDIDERFDGNGRHAEGSSSSDSDYEPEPALRRRKARKTTNRRHSSTMIRREDKGVVLKPVMINDTSYECPKCRQVFTGFDLCNEHILHGHYGGSWPGEYACHLCNNLKFRGIYWLKQHMKDLHPGEKLPLYEALDRYIEEGVAPDLTYEVVPIDQNEDADSNKDNNVESTSNEKSDASGVCNYKIVMQEPSRKTSFVVPFRKDNHNKFMYYIQFPMEFEKGIPEDVLELVKQKDKKCTHCDLRLPTELQFRGHIKAAHEGEKYCYPCPSCPRKFYRIGKFLVHIHQIHFRQKKYFCERCGRTFNDEILMQAHIQRVHFGIMNPYKCIICGMCHNRRSALHYHLIRTHQVQIKSYVPIPTGGGRNKGKPKQESEPKPRGRRKWKNIGENKPSTNTTKTRIQKSSRRKIPDVSDEKEPCERIPCQMCLEESKEEVNFPSQQELDVHVKRTHMGIPRPYPCTICEKKYSSPQKVEKHMMECHIVRSDVEIGCEVIPPHPYVCLPCGKSFKDKCRYHKHLQSIFHRPHMRPHVCEICSQGFQSLTFLKNHQTQKHYKELNLTPFLCTYCGKILNNKRSLTDHIKTLHTKKDAKFKCPHCDMVFQHKSAKEHHINIRHTKQKVVMCTLCPASFTCNFYLQNHLKRVHCEVKPYECKICFKRFSDPPTFKRHEEAHSNITHDCPHCGKTGFKTRHALRCHVRTRHEEASRNVKPPPLSPIGVDQAASSATIFNFNYADAGLQTMEEPEKIEENSNAMMQPPRLQLM